MKMSFTEVLVMLMARVDIYDVLIAAAAAAMLEQMKRWKGLVAQNNFSLDEKPFFRNKLRACKVLSFSRSKVPFQPQMP